MSETLILPIYVSFTYEISTIGLFSQKKEKRCSKRNLKVSLLKILLSLPECFHQIDRNRYSSVVSNKKVAGLRSVEK